MAGRLSDLGGWHLAVPLTSMLCCLFPGGSGSGHREGGALFPLVTHAFLHSDGDEASGGWFLVTRGQPGVTGLRRDGDPDRPAH